MISNSPPWTMIYTSHGVCSNIIPTVSVSNEKDGFLTRTPLSCVSRYTLDMSGWEIKTDSLTNKKYIDVYFCLENFFVLSGVSSAHYSDGTGWIEKQIMITGNRIIFYKSKGIDANQTSLFQSKLGTIYNQDLPGNFVNCTGVPPPDWNPQTTEEEWMYQCGCVNYRSNEPELEADNPVVVKNRLTRLNDIMNLQQPILNWIENTSAPESVIYDTDCVKTCSCGTASQLVSLRNIQISNPNHPHIALYNSSEDQRRNFITPNDSGDTLRKGRFKVTEDDADFNSDTGPYIYFIILPNCGYREWDDPSVDGVVTYGSNLDRAVGGGYGFGGGVYDSGVLGTQAGRFNLNIGCTPRGAFPCNFTDQECELCVRAAPATYDYEEWLAGSSGYYFSPNAVQPVGWSRHCSTGPDGTFECTWEQITECKENEDLDCHGNCFPKSWLDDGFCHNGKFRHPQYCKGAWKLPNGDCAYGTKNDHGILSVPEIFLNCPRFANQTKNCSWDANSNYWNGNNKAPICKGVCCEVYQGMFTGACTIKSRNECVLYQSLAHSKAFQPELDLGMSSDFKEEQWMMDSYNLPTENRTIDTEGGYFWEISAKDTVASPTTCSVCSEVKGLSTGCVYFGCCEEVGGGTFCSPSGLESDGNKDWQYINPYRARPTNGGIGTWSTESNRDMQYSAWFNFDYSIVNFYDELLLKTKSNGWWEGIAHPVKQEVPHTGYPLGYQTIYPRGPWGRASQHSAPDYTHNNMGTRVCCINGECSLKTISDCKEAGGFFHINLNVCDNIYCEPDRIGRCCEMFEGVATGNCLLVTKAECEGIGGKNWLIDNLGNPIACTHTDIVTWGDFSALAGETFEFQNPTFHYPDCRLHTQCVSAPRDLRACCLEGGRCATLFISHCKNIGGTPDMLRYGCNQTNPLNGSTPTDIKILDCGWSDPYSGLGFAQRSHIKYWCDPECINPVCEYRSPDPTGPSGVVCCDDTWWYPQCAQIVDELNLGKVCTSNIGCGGTDVKCGPKNPGDCHTIHSFPGCNNENCCIFVCQFAPNCCYDTWHPLCKFLADALCA